ncbi:DUF421 domain-containing protein [Virgibacillus litoralis]|uniref:Uncharacterized membrane protein YcaP (DUF421 family) n=1 Tax=Virgibacillus litoralis TaxID=578221 RepID=A0ABS4HDW5_9BACI|nr:DUF421 domain-containing protein [Virgibacillus litoralis]MBP1948632.1 uncharacterized membrane protein YcaP (DUF421 family) [Virgibacillus litoralis]
MSEYTIVIVRTIFAFFFILLLARILGSKQIAQLTFFDYITGISIGNMAAALAIDVNMQPMDAIIGLLLFSLLTTIVVFGALKSLKFRKLVEGRPTILMRNGNVLEKNLLKEKITFDDLMQGLREKSVFKLADVETATLETSGVITVMKKAEFNPLTPKDMGIPVEAEHTPSVIIVDGILLDKRLNYLGYSKEWLLGEVLKQGAKNFKDVFLAQIDSKGNVYVDLYNEEEKVTQVKQKPLLSAQLRKMQADLEGFAIQTNDQNAKQMYYNQSIELQDLINKINPYLKE